MTLTRPRILAALFCLLLVLAAGIFVTLSRFGPAMMHSPAADLQTFDVQEQGVIQHEPAALPAIDPLPPAQPPAPEAPDAEAAPVATSAIAVSMPRIAYTYGYTFRVDSAGIAAVQERHLALCRRLGPALCRITAMQRGESAGGTGANLKLQVAASLADRFGRDLVAIVSGGGGDTLDRSITAEDLSREMIDSEARIRTREVLIQRLTTLLQTRSGNIAQAVEAERAINTAQEELEAARAALADMRGRVAMSTVEIAYQARGPAPESPNPIAQAVGQVGAAAAGSVGAMILIVGVMLPWALAGMLVFLAIRAVGRRRERAVEAVREDEAEAGQDEAAPAPPSDSALPQG